MVNVVQKHLVANQNEQLTVHAWFPLASQEILQSGPFISVGRNISALVGCIKKLRALYEVQLLETFQIQQLDLY